LNDIIKKWIYNHFWSRVLRSLGVPVLKVTVEYLGYLKRIIGNGRREEIEVVDNALISDLLMTLSEKYGTPFNQAVYEPKGSDVKSNFMVTINGYLLNQLKGLETKLRDGDHVILMPVVSGG
jgi:molybdopterin synthase sulfur carrier subunit